LELPEIRDVGDRLVAIGRLRHVAKQAEPRSSRHSVAWWSGEMVVEWRNGEATRVLSFLDPNEALEAAGLHE